MKISILCSDPAHPIFPHLVACADRIGAEIEQDPCALRVADPIRYPAFFEYRGAEYQVTIKRMTDAGHIAGNVWA